MSGNRVSTSIPNGVMFNAYPDSIGKNLGDIVHLLQRPELEQVFSLFYVLPTFFNSDLDRGFSIIDYDLNQELVHPDDLKSLEALGILLKFDLVLNHLSVASPQFKDMLEKGDDSPYKDFFIDWNFFWENRGRLNDEGVVIPDDAYLDKLFMRKPGLPTLKVRFPDGSERPYWNTFYQAVSYPELAPDALAGIDGLSETAAAEIRTLVNDAIHAGQDPRQIDFKGHDAFRSQTLDIIEGNRSYLGQMDLNANSDRVWAFYDETLKKLSDFGGKLIRLDAFAYLHKEPGETNFFNKPGTWDYLARLKEMGEKYGLMMLPEIHSEYGSGLHREMAQQGYFIYDFFFPGLVIDALDGGSGNLLLRWIHELQDRGIRTVNMLGCHDGIPVLDLKGGGSQGLLTDEEIDAVVDQILQRGGRVKNLYGPDGKKIAYYQVNATFFSALGEDAHKLLLARAIQLFMPGIPQVWYLDLFAGKNDYAAASAGGAAGHKEINRTTLTMEEIEHGLQQDVVKEQLKLLRLRNTSSAFHGVLEASTDPEDVSLLQMCWVNGACRALLKADLKAHTFRIEHTVGDGEHAIWTYGQDVPASGWIRESECENSCHRPGSDTAAQWPLAAG